jgi:hypothetical protein
MAVQSSSQTDVSLSFQELLSSYSKMSDIVKSIQNFTRQTELLSYNSSIEAARAGTAGKGFDVISKEIKQLAKKSAESNEKSAEQLDIIKVKVNEVFAARMADIAFDTIDKVDRNLFERNCDVQAWATFDKVIEAAENEDEAVCRQISLLLKNLVDIYEVYYDVFITDMKGKVIASGTHWEIIGSDQSAEEWFKEIAAQKTPTVNDMHYLDFVKGYTVGYNCPIFDKTRRMCGILSTRFNWSFIYDIIDSARISPDGELLLLNSEGLVIGSKKRQEVFDRIAEKTPAVQKALNGAIYGYSIETGHDGALRIVGYAHTRGYNAYKGKNWSVIAIETMSGK